MKLQLSYIKGIHPGLLVERELKKKKIAKGRFAISLGEFPQTLATITKGKRRMNTALALKIEKALGMEEGFLMQLQVFYDIAQIKRKHSARPDLSKLRRILFWDTHIEKIDWEKQKRAVIKRVFERGNETEKNEITRFYGQETIDYFLKKHE
ncbi:MAG: plasmid maintenance system antidote protein [Bacteroidota bacterium]